MAPKPKVVPFRADAVLVYRSLQRRGASTAVDLASDCFPWVTFGPVSSVRAIRRRSVKRVFDSILWMRGQGVAITCLSVPGVLSTFVLGDVLQGPEAIGSGQRGRIVALGGEDPEAMG